MAATLVKRYGYLTKRAAGLIIKKIVISVETVAATLVKRYGYLTQCVAGLIIKEIIILVETVVATLVKRCSRPYYKANFNFS